MRAEPDAEAGVLLLRFDSARRLRSHWTRAAKRGLLLIRVAEAPVVGAPVRLRLSGGQVEVEITGKVHQVFRSGSDHGVAVELDPSMQPEIPVAERAVTPDQDAPSTTAVPDSAAADRTEMTGASTAAEIRQMNVSQKMRLASRAGRIERQILLRDTSPQVLMGLLANPRIDEQEVCDLVRSPHAASGVLQHVAKNRRWSANYDIRLALVKNPKTPSPLAQRLLPTLRKTDLQSLAKSTNVREAIKGAALRLYLEKI